MAALSDALSVVWVAFLLGGCGLAVGMAVRIALMRYVTLPPSLGLSIGMGLSTITLAAVLHRALFNTLAGFDLLFLVLILTLYTYIGYYYILKNRHDRALIQFWGKLRQYKVVAMSEAACLLASLLVLLPMLGFGLTYWTSGTNDFPSYAASAQIWMTSPAAFRAKHPDPFGAGQIDRASYEKPICTALLVEASKISGIPPYRLLTPILLVLMFVGISTMVALCKHIFETSYIATLLSVLIPAYSIVPISRVYDAQIGQVAATALLACTLCLIAAGSPRHGRSGTAWLGIMSAVVATATLGANFTLVLGCGIMLAGLQLWLIARDRGRFRERLVVAGFCAIGTAAFSSPFLGKSYHRSFELQVTGIFGFDIPLASPLAAIGQQPTLASVGTLGWMLLAWAILIAVVGVFIWATSKIDKWDRLFHSVLLVAIVLNAAIIGMRLGWANYATHKWFAVAIPLVMPILLCYVGSALINRSGYIFVWPAIPLFISCCVMMIGNAVSPKIVIGRNILDLAGNATLSKIDALNIRSGNQYSASILALLVPSKSVFVIDATYAPGSPPHGNEFLVPRDPKALEAYGEVQSLNDDYALAKVDFALRGEGKISR